MSDMARQNFYKGENKNADEINMILSQKLDGVSDWPFYAQALAEAIHEGQVDKSGQPYIDHVRRVVARTQELLERHYLKITVDLARLHDEMISVAWLHDVIEDDPYLSFKHFNYMTSYNGGVQRVPWMVMVLSRSEQNGRTYQEYIENIGRFENAGERFGAPSGRPLHLVKLADLWDNRGRGGIPKSLEKRYDRAIDTLREMQKEEVA